MNATTFAKMLAEWRETHIAPPSSEVAPGGRATAWPDASHRRDFTMCAVIRQIRDGTTH